MGYNSYQLIISFNIALTIIPVFLIIKNSNTRQQRKKIIAAIRTYASLHHADVCELFDEMEPYKSTLFRWWDWGHKRIVPPDMYELIKPYIRMENP